MTDFKLHGSFLALFRLQFIHPLPPMLLFAVIDLSFFTCLLLERSVKMLFPIPLKLLTVMYTWKI